MSRSSVRTVSWASGQSLVFLESRDSLLHHAIVSCVDDAGSMLGELHDHGVGARHPIGARDVQIVVVSLAEYRTDLRA